MTDVPNSHKRIGRALGSLVLNLALLLTMLALGIGPPLTDSAGQQPQPCIRVTPTQLLFGQVNVGSSSSRQVIVQNVGRCALRIAAVHLQESVHYRLTGSVPNTLPPGAAFSLVVTFTPRSVGQLTDLLIIKSDDPVNPLVQIPCTGIGVSPSPIRILGKKCEDLNGNGICDQGEPGMKDVTITLIGPLPVPTVQRTLTGVDGSFGFTVTATGIYQVSETVPSGCEATRPASVTISVSHGVTPPLIFFSNKCKPPPPVTVRVCKFRDHNRNRHWDSDEWGVGWWPITVSGPGTLRMEMLTTVTGCVEFVLEIAGQYVFEEASRPGWEPITPTRVTVHHPGPITEIFFGNDWDP